jgi:hypothetical protein
MQATVSPDHWAANSPTTEFAMSRLTALIHWSSGFEPSLVRVIIGTLELSRESNAKAASWTINS